MRDQQESTHSVYFYILTEERMLANHRVPDSEAG